MQRTTFLVYTQKVIKIHLAALLEGFENRKLESLYPKINGLFLRKSQKNYIAWNFTNHCNLQMLLILLYEYKL